jgi:hypothetical protein
VLLTRSRLCTRPKPGSSLHLHVLGTPPAFVLSQDQTLREELHTKSRQKYNPGSKATIKATAGSGSKSGSAPGGTEPLRQKQRPRYTVRPQAQDGVNLGTADRATCEDRPFDGVEPGHTPRSRIRSKGAHAVEFSKTVAPFRKVFLLKRRARLRLEPGRTHEYSAGIRRQLEDSERRRPAPCSAIAQNTTWTETVRSRGRSSKSISTICCQVPRLRRPSVRGKDSEGPIRAARWWAWELES